MSDNEDPGEHLVGAVIGVLMLLVICGLVSAVTHCSGDKDGYTTEDIMFSDVSRAKSQREMVEQLKRQNDLKEQELKNNNKQ